MHIRSISLALFLLAPVVAIASEGIIYGAVYECEADEINRVMVEGCTGRFPNLSKQTNEALESWRKRNLARASAAKEACSNMGISENASVSDREAFARLIADKKEEILSSFEADIRKQGLPFCREAIRQLQEVGGPLEIR
ncbi:MAG TPA: hypothetical protein VF774_25770 [Pseudoduganella sp.]|jgi:hypothetical protein